MDHMAFDFGTGFRVPFAGLVDAVDAPAVGLLLAQLKTHTHANRTALIINHARPLMDGMGWEHRSV